MVCGNVDGARQTKTPPLLMGMVNVVSGDGSAQSNRPAFPSRVLYGFQPRVGGIRLPDKPTRTKQSPTSANALTVIAGACVFDASCVFVPSRAISPVVPVIVARTL